MNQYHCLLMSSLVGCAVLCASGPAWSQARLTVGGRPTAAVVVGQGATRVERKAADEFVKYVKLMSGATLAVGTESDSPARVVIGTPATNQLVAALVKKCGATVDEASHGADGFVIKTIANGKHTDLLLTGASSRACLYAVYHLLSDVFHVGYFWDGMYIPKSANLSLPSLDIVSNCRWPIRQYNQGCAYTYNWMDFWTWDQQKSELEWAAWHGQNRILWPIHKRQDAKSSGAEKYLADCSEKVVKYAHELGMDVVGVDDVYNVDPYPEERVSKDPAEEDRIMSAFARETMAKGKAKDPSAVWYTSGWALLNPGWRIETAKGFFDSIGSDDFYVSDVWAEGHPIYKQYDYFYGKKWVFGVLHSFGGNALLHGHIDDLAKRMEDLSADPRADRCLGVYINPEINHYNELYFDLASALAWNPQGVRVDDYLRDYSVRRYGVKSAPAMVRALQELRSSVYSTNDVTPAYYQVRMNDSFPSIIYDRVRYVPKLNAALGVALSQKTNQKGNLLYARDLVDMAKQSLGEVFNYHAITLYNAFAAGDRKRFDDSADVILDAMSQLESLLRTCSEYQIGAIMASYRSIPGLTAGDFANAERTIKNQVFTFADRDDLRDYNRRDMLELVHSYYLPRVRVYIDHLRTQMSSGSAKIDKTKLNGAYAGIEQSWLAKPLPVMKVDNTWSGSISAVEGCLKWLKNQERAVSAEPTGRIQNGGFESGNLDGWRVAATNTAFEVQRDVKPFMGFCAVRFAADRGVNAGDHTFSLSQRLRVSSNSPMIGIHYLLDECSSTAHARLVVSGFDKAGVKKYQLVYFFGGDSWDYKRATPEETGGFYAASFKGDSSLGEWHKLEASPARDLDTTFGKGTCESLKVDCMDVDLGCWTSPGEGQHVSGYFDEITVSE